MQSHAPAPTRHIAGTTARPSALLSPLVDAAPNLNPTANGGGRGEVSGCQAARHSGAPLTGQAHACPTRLVGQHGAAMPCNPATDSTPPPGPPSPPAAPRGRTEWRSMRKTRPSLWCTSAACTREHDVSSRGTSTWSAALHGTARRSTVRASQHNRAGRREEGGECG